jgi:hypothetical protein
VDLLSTLPFRKLSLCFQICLNKLLKKETEINAKLLSVQNPNGQIKITKDLSNIELKRIPVV